MTDISVPYGMAVHGEEEIEAVVNVLRTSTQMGKNVREMERQVSALFDKKHGVMVNSGSSALMLAMDLLDLPEGSEIITPALTFSTTVACIVKNNLIPAFVDVEEGTYLIDANCIEPMITANTKAMLIPHLIGNIFDWETVLPLVKKHNLILVEDSADTLGGTIRGVSSGHLADLSITSFYGSHVINAGGNGGMLCLNSDELAQEALLLRSWGRRSSLIKDSKQAEAIENRFNVEVGGLEYDAKFIFDRIGYNIEPNEMCAAYGVVQLSKLQANIQARIDNFARQLEFFKQYEEWFILPRQTPDTITGWLAYPMTVREGAPFSRRDMQIFLEKRNIQTRVVFTGNITRQPGFDNIASKLAQGGYPEADKVMRGGVLLACHHGLTSGMLDHVHQVFENFASQF